MKSRSLLQLLLAFTSLVSSEDVIGSGHSCLRSSPADDGQTRVTFLRVDTAGVRSLYLTLWSEDARLLSCEVNTDPMATERYRAHCDRSHPALTQRFNISAVLAPGARCARVSSGAPKFAGRTREDGTEEKARRKRGVIFPGTLWCGTGSKAAGYEQLGMFESADRCCREHDHCPHVIPSFTVNYGVFNTKFFTVSHCDCDQRFRQCLLGVNDTISSMVGYSFFNILQVPCFDLTMQKQCTQMYWFGMCKVAKEAPYAYFKSPLPFNTSDVTTRYGDSTDSTKLTSSEGQHVTESPAISPHRKSNKSEHRCSTRDPVRGDMFHRRRTKGKGCKRLRKLHTVAPFQMPPISRAHSTTPSLKTGPLNASKSNTKKKRVGRKKSTRKGLLAYPTQRREVPPRGTTNSYPQSTTHSTPSLTQTTALQLHSSTAPTAVTKTTKTHRKAPKQSRCCGFTTPPRGDTFQPHCKSCQKTTSSMTTVTPSTATYGLPIKVTAWLKKTAETPTQETLKRLWSTATTAMPVTSKLKTAGRGLKQNIALHNMTDKQLLCGSLKHLDECKYKIPPLEKRYELQNMDSKTAYHCDCISRMAVHIKSLKQPSVLPSLLMDFVSRYCFKLPKEKKCHRRKSCSGGFTKASDLLRAVKKIEEKDTAGVPNSSSDRKRGIPVRLYKRCLRLEREADIMAQLT